MRAPLLLMALTALLAVPAPGPGSLHAQQDTVQQQIRASQERLAQIRAERERLQEEMQSLEGRVSDITGELSNIERQVATSAEALRELDYQTAALAASVEAITGELLRSRDRLRERQVVLHQRLRNIYRQGPLHAVRVLLSAHSFSDLLNRYKYLYLVSVHDRLLFEEITELEGRLVEQEASLQRNLGLIERLRAEKLSEFTQLQQLEQSRSRTLQDVRARVSQAEGRIQQLAADERRLTSTIDGLERRRIEEERRRAAAGVEAAAGSLSTSHLGQLRWPVQGDLLYGFGPERRPNGVTLRRNGIGISASPGTAVQAVRDGTVVMAQRMEGFGPGVVLSHGEGFYTLYLYLGEIRVREGQDVAEGTVLGTVGTGSEDGPHLYFQLLTPVRERSPVPVDPLPWLRQQ